MTEDCAALLAIAEGIAEATSSTSLSLAVAGQPRLYRIAQSHLRTPANVSNFRLGKDNTLIVPLAATGTDATSNAQ